MKTGLMNTFNIKLHLNKGFSLIELLVVVAIIGIISAVGYPNIMKPYLMQSDTSNSKLCTKMSKFFLQF